MRCVDFMIYTCRSIYRIELWRHLWVWRLNLRGLSIETFISILEMGFEVLDWSYAWRHVVIILRWQWVRRRRRRAYLVLWQIAIRSSLSLKIFSKSTYHSFFHKILKSKFVNFFLWNLFLSPLPHTLSLLAPPNVAKNPFFFLQPWFPPFYISSSPFIHWNFNFHRSSNGIDNLSKLIRFRYPIPATQKCIKS